MLLLGWASEPGEGLPQDCNQGSGPVPTILPGRKRNSKQVSAKCFLPIPPSLFAAWPPAPKSLSQMLYPALARTLILHWPEVGNVGLARHLQSPTHSSNNIPFSSAFSILPTLFCSIISSPSLPMSLQHGLFKGPPLSPHWHWYGYTLNSTL